MAEPQEFRVLQHLKASLGALTVAAGAFYDVDPSAVLLDPDYDVAALTAAGAPRPFVIIETRDEEWIYHPSGEVRLTMPLSVHWVHEPADPTDAVIGVPRALTGDERLCVFMRGCADVERALTSDTSRGGNAVDTRITNRVWQPAPFQGGQAVWAELSVECIVYRSYGVPA